MKERPILFSAPMVRAILDGTKTQTRRAVKFKPWHQIEERGDGTPWPWMYDSEYGGDCWIPCPYGQPGDRLWVREACIAEELPDGLDGLRYLADEAFIAIQSTREDADRWLDLRYYRNRQSPVAQVNTVPSIHMPRWASRITLEVTGVRVERLQDISHSDAEAEGWNPEKDCCAPLVWYAALWEQINGPGSWEANPWVWAVEFKRVPE